MTPSDTLTPRLEELILRLIDEGIWATRERLGYKRAIHTLDNESKYLSSQPYSTNLDFKFDKLTTHHPDLIDRITDYIAQDILGENIELKLVVPSEYEAKKYTIGVLNLMINRLNGMGFEVVNLDRVSSGAKLVLLVGVHTQELVEFWRKFDSQISVVVALLGTTRHHVQNDLGLPAEKYNAIASWDALGQISPALRKVMIPGAYYDSPRVEELVYSTQVQTSDQSLSLVTNQPTSEIAGNLAELKEWVKRITYPGEFLLSVNKFSDSWLYMVEFNNRVVRKLSSDVLQHMILRYLVTHPEPHVLFCSEFGSLSEDEFATADVVYKAFMHLGDLNLSFERYWWRPELDKIELNDEAFKDKQAIGFCVLSIHVDLLLKVIAKIRDVGGNISTLITIIERDDVGRAAYAAEGVDLIPFILFDANNKELTTVLERSDPIYRAYHSLFM